MGKVLIIEDNDELNKAYAFILKYHGHDVETAFNGEEGLDKAEVFKPEVILLDYLMPKMSGKEFLEHYDASRHPDVRIVLLTNLSEQKGIKEALKTGVYRYALKADLGPTQLVALVNELL